MHRMLVLPACLVLLLPSLARGQALAPYTGFTRPGTPNDTRKDGKIVYVADDPDERKNAVGGTVYFLVLERKGDDKDDPWGTGVKDLANRFRRGVDAGGTASPSLDMQAKYLYLFQVVNDRRTEAPIQGSGIHLQVDLKDKPLTSWGSFPAAGFGMSRGMDDDKPGGPILPVSSGFKDGSPSEIIYRSPSPATPATRPYYVGVAEKPTRPGKGVAKVTWEEIDPAVEP